MINIIPYENQHASIFKSLNMEWLAQYNLLEEYDVLYLSNPREMIIDKGGEIYLAQSGIEIVGTAAITNEGGGVFELVKMFVSPQFRGMGISKMLLEKCIERAKALGAQKMRLYSNSQLTAAIALYEKSGFHHLPPDNTHYVTADIKMERDL